MRNIRPAERLFVAADFKPTSDTGQEGVLRKVFDLAAPVRQAGACLKVNSALRMGGYQLLNELHEQDVRVFADYKLNDIGETLETDGMLLNLSQPRYLTVMCSTGVEAMKRLNDQLEWTSVLGVTVLTTFTEDDCLDVYNRKVQEEVLMLAMLGMKAGIDGFVCSPKEAKLLRTELGDDPLIITPGVRFDDSTVKGDDQNAERVMTPARALEMGADGVVMGRPITQASDPYMAALRAIHELSGAL